MASEAWRKLAPNKRRLFVIRSSACFLATELHETWKDCSFIAADKHRAVRFSAASWASYICLDLTNPNLSTTDGSGQVASGRETTKFKSPPSRAGMSAVITGSLPVRYALIKKQPGTGVYLDA